MRVATHVEQQLFARVLITLLDLDALLTRRFHQPFAATIVDPRIGGEANRLCL
jgi:hypothetical protein